MRTKRKCKIHGLTPHGAQNRCLICKKAQSRTYRADRSLGRAISGKKVCERDGCGKRATMWPSNPRWCGHACRIYCYRLTPKGKRALRRSTEARS